MRSSDGDQVECHPPNDTVMKHPKYQASHKKSLVLYTSDDQNSTLAACARVSRSFKDPAQKILFSDIVVDKPSRANSATNHLYQAIQSNPYLGTLVRKIYMSIDVPAKSSYNSPRTKPYIYSRKRRILPLRGFQNSGGMAMSNGLNVPK